MRWVLCVMTACGSASATPEGDAHVADGEVDGGTGDGSTATPIRVLTINLKTALPSDAQADQRTAMVAALIEAEQPDVIALQEITQSGSMTNRAELLGQMTGYAWEWRQTHSLFIGEEGIGVMTRGQITWHDDTELSHTEFAGALHRAVIGARVNVAGRTIELFATHLTVAGSTTDRADQAIEALTFARAHHAVGIPAFFAGDLNAEPDEFAMKMLRGEDTHDGVTGDLIDAWSQAETSDGFTIPSDGPDRRIDYIYAFPGSGTATDCKTVLEQPSNGLRASDHLGVICAFE
jgi:endonuclease/exonuclease/phosphatase family metal-dependent hydrolase